MKTILLTIVLAGLSVSSFAQAGAATAPAAVNSAASQGLKIGDDLPMASTQLKTTNGKNTSLAQNMTKGGLLVMFSCNTCPFVVKSQQRTQEMMKRAAEMNIGMVILNANQAQRGDADSYEAMVSYADKQHYSVPYAIDEQSTLANAFGATRTPEVYLFNADGKLVYKGAMEDNPSDPAGSKKMYLADAMKNMRNGSKINPAETKSIGCSIKRQ